MAKPQLVVFQCESRNGVRTTKVHQKKRCPKGKKVCIFHGVSIFFTRILTRVPHAIRDKSNSKVSRGVSQQVRRPQWHYYPVAFCSFSKRSNKNQKCL
ncbi:hypothetical protein HanHA300_Chr11g0409351 [Helianthus annuus]|nr:hypothetical protein HanHA300_Chr11g0409351 [Helianthus annuus]KAJ0518062.1 hypothetical protein HanHA89_Chr11g0433001 [Helianthus annuus]KAJ0686089.1 hypothetical protein HanLR1_Chr11g0410611 [Helianthus annuus]KAJ0689936.1 hypothetical protein HanOQP8_Chr11g0411971 [Helianthus annuus]